MWLAALGLKEYKYATHTLTRSVHIYMNLGVFNVTKIVTNLFQDE